MVAYTEQYIKAVQRLAETRCPHQLNYIDEDSLLFVWRDAAPNFASWAAHEKYRYRVCVCDDDVIAAFRLHVSDYHLSGDCVDDLLSCDPFAKIKGEWVSDFLMCLCEIV